MDMRRLIPLAALFPVALALCACGGKPVDPNAQAPAPDLASNFSQPLDARGFDPGWGWAGAGIAPSPTTSTR